LVIDWRLIANFFCLLHKNVRCRCELTRTGMTSADPPDMGQQSELLKKRTMQFAVDVCELIRRLPLDEPGSTVRRQLTRAATSVAFNYRATCRTRSHAEFTAKLGTVVEESDEAQGWLEFIEAAKLLESAHIGRLIEEARQITAIMSASYGTARDTARRMRDSTRQTPQSSNQLPNYQTTKSPD
jgi:four helix bundle protein